MIHIYLFVVDFINRFGAAFVRAPLSASRPPTWASETTPETTEPAERCVSCVSAGVHVCCAQEERHTTKRPFEGTKSAKKDRERKKERKKRSSRLSNNRPNDRRFTLVKLKDRKKESFLSP